MVSLCQSHTLVILTLCSKILHVLSMSSNLLFVHRFCKDNNASFYFDASKFNIQDLPSGKLLYSGLLLFFHRLPLVGLILLLPLHQQFLHKCGIIVLAILIPHVFRHVSHNFLPVKMSQTILPFCTHRVEGKMHSLLFSDFISIACKPLEIIHSDVWCPSPITSYVTFVDDFTRFTWFFPIKNMSQIL